MMTTDDNIMNEMNVLEMNETTTTTKNMTLQSSNNNNILNTLIRVTITLLLSQFISLLLCMTGVFSQSLTQFHNISTPSVQNIFSYSLLALFYTPIFLIQKCKLRKSWNSPWYIYPLIALCDSIGNYLVVKAYKFTSITSVQLLDCLSIPNVLILSFIFLRRRYGWIHLMGVILCVAGVIIVIVGEAKVNRDDISHHISFDKSALLGDLLCVCGSICYAISNVAQEAVILRTATTTSSSSSSTSSSGNSNSNNNAILSEELAHEQDNSGNSIMNKDNKSRNFRRNGTGLTRKQRQQQQQQQSIHSISLFNNNSSTCDKNSCNDDDDDDDNTDQFSVNSDNDVTIPISPQSPPQITYSSSDCRSLASMSLQMETTDIREGDQYCDTDNDKGVGGQEEEEGEMNCSNRSIASKASTLSEIVKLIDNTVEYLSMTGIFGTLFSTAILFIVERQELQVYANNRQPASVYMYLAGFSISMLGIYTLVPVLLFRASATFMNLSFLSSDLWAMIVSLLIFGGRGVTWTWGIAAILVISGVSVYHIRGDSYREEVPTDKSDAPRVS